MTNDKLLKEIKDWLENEMFVYEDYVKARENGDEPLHDDGTDDINCGHHKCAEQLLMYITRKEKE